MKKIVLAFSPGASPTTMPLGIAALSAYIKRLSPKTEVEVRDLSIGMRLACFDKTPESDLTVPFFRGKLGSFFDEGLYLAYQQKLFVYYELWRAMEHNLKNALQDDELVGPDADAYSAMLYPLLPLCGDETLALSAAFPEQVLHSVLVAKFIKKSRPKLTVLLGGAALSALDVDELMTAVPQIDVVFRGEGEAGLLGYLDGAPVEQIRGFSYRKDGGIFHNSSPLGIIADDLPAPDLAALPFDQYLNPEPVAPVSFSRGCRWRKCRFCSHNAGFAGYRIRDTVQFVNQLAHYRYGMNIRHFYFADQYIGADDLAAVSKEIIRQKLDVRFHVMGRPTADYTNETFAAAFEAGCRWISWGVESFSQNLLDTCNKGTAPKTVMRVIADASAANISNLAMMIFGLPGTSDRAFQTTLDCTQDISEHVDAFTSSSFQLFENTPFFRRAPEFGLHPEAREVLFKVKGQPVHSYRWAYSMTAESGDRCLPLSGNESAKWKQWQLFVRGGDTFFESLPAEHYLLTATQRRDTSSFHLTPNRPAPPRPFRRAG